MNLQFLQDHEIQNFDYVSRGKFENRDEDGGKCKLVTQ